MLLRSRGMAAPAIVHIEFKSSDFARTSAFYAKLFDWRTEQNASASYMKLDSTDGPSGGWVRADLVQSPGPIAYLPVDDLAAKLDEVEQAGRPRAGAQHAVRGRRRGRPVRRSRRQRARPLAAQERRAGGDGRRRRQHAKTAARQAGRAGEARPAAKPAAQAEEEEVAALRQAARRRGPGRGGAGVRGAWRWRPSSRPRACPGREIAFVRFAVGLVACAASRRTRVRMRARNKLGLVMRGAYGGAAVLFYFLGIAHLPVGIATLLNYTAPVFTAIYAALFLGEAITRADARRAGADHASASRS